jgi:hypothetical protein
MAAEVSSAHRGLSSRTASKGRIVGLLAEADATASQ